MISVEVLGWDNTVVFVLQHFSELLYGVKSHLWKVLSTLYCLPALPHIDLRILPCFLSTYTTFTQSLA